MPFYDYKCNTCNTQIEIQQSIKDEAIKICPECSSTDFHKTISHFNVIYAVGGFHITDYPSNSGH